MHLGQVQDLPLHAGFNHTMSRITVDLSGNVAFVTGAGSGIGRGLARQMALDGVAGGGHRC